MYSVVLMVAATSGGDMASFGKDKGGCTGCSGYTASCNGGGFLGLKDKHGCNGCSGGGFLGLKDKHGCSGGCHGSSLSCHGGCTGTIVHSAPIVEVAPAGCHGSSCHGCSGSSCHGGGFLGLRDGGGLFKKHKGNGCNGCSGGCW